MAMHIHRAGALKLLQPPLLRDGQTCRLRHKTKTALDIIDILPELLHVDA
jgi:hypothetical protein